MAGFDVIVTVEIKPHPGSKIMEQPPTTGKLIAKNDDAADCVGSAQMCGIMAYEAACDLLKAEKSVDTLKRIATFSEAELKRIFG